MGSAVSPFSKIFSPLLRICVRKVTANEGRMCILLGLAIFSVLLFWIVVSLVVLIQFVVQFCVLSHTCPDFGISYSIWDLKEEKVEADFQEARTLASDSWTRDPINYFIDCHSSVEDDRLWVIGGTNAGTIGYFPVNYGSKVIGPVEAILEKGHAGVVRSALPISSLAGNYSPNQNSGMFGWTGGEDGRLCCWLSDENSDVNHAWISTNLVMKPSKTRKKNRHHPY